MERMIKLHIERLPEGVYLATSDEVHGNLFEQVDKGWICC